MALKLAVSAEDVPPANMDYEAIHEALMNLVGNAIDACLMSDRGGDYQVSVRLFEEEGTLVFQVEDNGCGMDEEVKRKAFHTFFTTKNLGGTGLGLLTTRRLVQEHGGDISFESETGKGTLFSIRFPRERLPAETVTSGEQREPPRIFVSETLRYDEEEAID